jgi:DNA-directed RNA polymerase I, II, and III subunit RPABC2
MSKKLGKTKFVKTEDDISDVEETEDIEEKDDIEEEDNDNYSLEDENETLECVIEKAIDEDYLNENENSDIEEEITEIIIPNNERISSNRLTKYEMVRILGERIKQLTMGAKPLIKNYESLDYERIAIEELKLNMIPYKIKRPLPNGKFEIWTLDELQKEHLLSFLDD